MQRHIDIRKLYESCVSALDETDRGLKVKEVRSLLMADERREEGRGDIARVVGRGRTGKRRKRRSRRRKRRRKRRRRQKLFSGNFNLASSELRDGKVTPWVKVYRRVEKGVILDPGVVRMNYRGDEQRRRRSKTQIVKIAQ